MLELEIDKEILEGCRKNKIKYQEKLYRLFFAYGMSISLRFSYSREEAVEILNDSFLKVFENLKKFDETKSFKAWFRRIIINTSIDYYRKNKLKNENTTTEINADIDVNFENSIMQNIQYEDIIKLLNLLSEKQRLIFILYELEGYKHDEIAEKLNIAPSTSRAELTRAKKNLRIFYKKMFE